MIARLSGWGIAALVWAAPAVAETAASGPLQQAGGVPANVSISGSFRVRYEALDGQFRPGLDESDDLISLRTTLFGEYRSGPFRLGAELIDARAYDADKGSSVGTGEVNAIELTQGYVGINLGTTFGEGSATSVQVGRFTMNLGSTRLVGRNNFRNSINAFTGIRADWEGRSGKALTLFYVLPHTRLPSAKASILDNEVKWDRESFNLSFWGAHLTLPNVPAGGALELYGFVLHEDDSSTRPTRNRHLYTPGFRLVREPKAGQWDYEVEAAYQFGSIRTSTSVVAVRQDVSAWTLHAEVGRQLSGGWKPRLSAELDIATGDSSGKDYGRFDSLFGPRRSDWGPTGIYGPLGRSNIVSPGVRVEVKPSARWDGFLGYRAAWAESQTDSFASTGVRDPSGSSGRFAGHQIEGRARYWIVPKILRLDSGFAALFWGRLLREAPNSNGRDRTLYGYTDITVTF